MQNNSEDFTVSSNWTTMRGPVMRMRGMRGKQTEPSDSALMVTCRTPLYRRINGMQCYGLLEEERQTLTTHEHFYRKGPILRKISLTLKTPKPTVCFSYTLFFFVGKYFGD